MSKLITKDIGLELLALGACPAGGQEEQTVNNDRPVTPTQ